MNAPSLSFAKAVWWFGSSIQRHTLVTGFPLIGAVSGVVIATVSNGAVKANREYALSNHSGITYAVPAHWLKAM